MPRSSPCRIPVPTAVTKSGYSRYKSIKLSAFLFRTPAQRAAVLRQVQRFEQKHGCGLELLALRRGYKGRRAGSVRDLARAIAAAMRAGGARLDLGLNVRKVSADIATLAATRKAHIDQRAADARTALERQIELDPVSIPLTGVVLDLATVSAAVRV